MLPWLALSPALSPIENLWSYVSNHLRMRSFSNPDALFDAVHEEWAKVPTSLLASLYAPMHKRCDTCIKQHGYPTKY